MNTIGWGFQEGLLFERMNPNSNFTVRNARAEAIRQAWGDNAANGFLRVFTPEKF